MASAAERADWNRRATGRQTLPVKPLPKIPEVLKKLPDFRAAWEQFEREMEDWRKSLVIPGPTIIENTTQNVRTIVQHTNSTAIRTASVIPPESVPRELEFVLTFSETPVSF